MTNTAPTITPILQGLALASCLSIAAATPAVAQVERPIERTYRVTADSSIVVRISGGPISVTTRSGDSAVVRLVQRVDVDTDREADDELANFTVEFEQQGPQIVLTVRRRTDAARRWRSDRARFSAELAVPANVRLDLRTSGGPITVRGEREAALNADTSGGAIRVDGGRGELTLDTSGGPITVGRALSVLQADTSGGRIEVGYVGPDAREVVLDTSGGSIDVGVDRAARLSVQASTSGGGVSIDGLSLSSMRTLTRNRVAGDLNGGGGRLSAETSGGSIRIHAGAAAGSTR